MTITHCELIEKLASEAAEQYILTHLPAWVRKEGWGAMETALLETVIANAVKRALTGGYKKPRKSKKSKRTLH